VSFFPFFMCASSRLATWGKSQCALWSLNYNPKARPLKGPEICQSCHDTFVSMLRI
jgi:hypothetical protein